MSNDPFNFYDNNNSKSNNARRPLTAVQQSLHNITNHNSATAVATIPSSSSSSPSSASSSQQPLLKHHLPQQQKSLNNNNPKNAGDLHAWSLFRQNLNSNFSETVLQQQQIINNNDKILRGSSPLNVEKILNKMSGTNTTSNPTTIENTGGTTGYPLRESAVNNLLSHPKYGAQYKNQDAFTYLRFGLPRVKAITTPNGDRLPVKHSSHHSSNSNFNEIDHQTSTRGLSKDAPVKNNLNNTKVNSRSGNGIGSVAINDELKRRFWGSESNLLRNSENESDSSGKELTPGNNLNRSSPNPTASNNKTHFNNRYNPVPSTHIDRYPKFLKQQSHLNRSSHNINDARYFESSTNQKKPSPDYHRNSPPDLHPQNSDPEDPTIITRMSPFNTDNEDDLNIDEPFVSPSVNHHGNSLPPPLAKHPHLVVKDLMYEIDKSSNWRRLCGFSRQKLRILEDISFDVRGGELMAIMATSANEGTALLDVLGARHDHRNGTARAEIYLNGVLTSFRHLSRMMAYVTQNMHLCSDMSARQALLFAGLLMGPASRSSTDVKRLTRTLLDELNLGEVRHTKLSELTHSERRRLHIAMHLLLDTELLMIDQPLLGLDIFDSFFMIEYLRQWAMVGGRIVIMTISPPTYEVFTMIHRVLLISAGRPLYVGPRKDFLKYFSSLGYPCPPFKNPSDYYLDLVTLDDLSQEALMESSQRIETLAEIHSRRSISEIFSSTPGPPAVLPAPFRRANFAMQFLALWIRALIFSFPYNVVHLFNRFMVTLLLSLMIGAIFWQVRTGREQEFVWDRIGFINTMISIGVVPILAAELVDAYSEKKYILSEVHQGFYSLPSYLLAKLLYSAPQTILIGLAYALPSCSMAGLQLHSNPNSLPFYLLLMLSYYMALRSFIFASVWICNRRSGAAILFGFLFSLFLLGSGLNIQYRDLSITHRWLRQVSPVRWLHEAVVAWEFEPNVSSNQEGSIVSSFLCSRNPVIQQPNAILVRADCGFQTRANILKWFEYQGGSSFQQSLRPSWHAFIALLVLYVCSFLLGSIIFCLRVYYYS